MDNHTARNYIHSNFRPEDRIAIVLIRKSSGAVIQRIANVSDVVSNEFQRWLRYMNNKTYEIYISMNTLRKQAQGRCKSDISDIRHVYLDFDYNGPEAIRKLSSRTEFPTPNHVIESSRGRYQVVWRVTGFEKTGAEVLMRGLAREFGADVAATDCARVLRLPGFNNHKRALPHFVSAENLSNGTSLPTDFPEYSSEELQSLVTVRRSRVRSPTGLSQSERDWAYANRALGRGDQPSTVMQAIAAYRQDKPNPEYYAKHTVEKARAFMDSAFAGRHDKGREPGQTT